MCRRPSASIAPGRAVQSNDPASHTSADASSTRFPCPDLKGNLYKIFSPQTKTCVDDAASNEPTSSLSRRMAS